MVQPYTRTQYAFLFPDGVYLTHHMWARVPVVHGKDVGYIVDNMETELWLDATRGGSAPMDDLDINSFTVRRFPFDEPCDLEHYYTVVVTDQSTEGPDVYPINLTITKMIPDLGQPWRGNVLVFKHGKSAGNRIISVEREDVSLVAAIVKRCVCQLRNISCFKSLNSGSLGMVWSAKNDISGAHHLHKTDISY
jgi:hypothetical protein